MQQTLGVLVSALMVEIGVMDGNEHSAEALGLALAAVISGTMVTTTIIMTIKWRDLSWQETQVGEAEHHWLFSAGKFAKH